MEQKDNFKIWEQIEKTDPKYTKAANVEGNKLTSLNGTYAAQQATKVFGPCGTGWGWRIVDDRFDNTKPIMKDDGSGLMFWCTQHTVIIDFWYIGDDGKEKIIPSVGHTPALSMGKNGPYYDTDPMKKSVTDAIKKALSFLGFSADVFMGLFDDVNYVNELKAEMYADNVEANEKAMIDKKKEFWRWAKEAVEEYKVPKNNAGLSVIHASKLAAADAKYQLCGEDGPKVKAFFVKAYDTRLAEINKEKQK